VKHFLTMLPELVEQGSVLVLVGHWSPRDVNSLLVLDSRGGVSENTEFIFMTLSRSGLLLR
jgi:hypothetical protein